MTKRMKDKLIKVLLVVIAVFYALFLLIDFLQLNAIKLSNHVKFLTIVLIFFISILLLDKDESKPSLNLQANFILASFLTIITDYLLLFTHRYKLGIGVFLIVHYLRLRGAFPKVKKKILISSLIVFILGLIFTNFFVALVLVYAFLLINNLNLAYLNNNHRKNNLFIAYILFVLCDLSVALNYLGVLKPFSTAAIWLFYLPSQVLLAYEIKRNEL